MAEKIYDKRTDDSLHMRTGLVECNVKSRVIEGQDAVTIGGGVAGDTELVAIIALTNLTGALNLTGFYKKDAADAAHTISLSALAGGFYDFHGMLNEAGALTIELPNAADNLDVIVVYREV